MWPILSNFRWWGSLVVMYKINNLTWIGVFVISGGGTGSNYQLEPNRNWKQLLTVGHYDAIRKADPIFDHGLL